MKDKRRKYGVLLIILALIIMQLPVAEADAATSVSDFRMEGSRLVQYRGTETSVSIPDTVEVIGESAFENNTTVELVVVPNSVKRIEKYAFWGCDNLEQVVLGKGITEIGDFAFANCKGLEQMTIPSNVKYIGILAFADCVNMTDIGIPPEVVGIHETSFDGCTKLVIHSEDGTYANRYAVDFYERQKEMPEYEDVANYPQDSDADTENTPPPAEITPSPETVYNGSELGSSRVVANRAVIFMDNTGPRVLENLPTQANDLTGEILTSMKSSLPKYTIVDGRIIADQAYYRSNLPDAVSVAGGIEEIGQFSFARSTVRSVELPSSLKTISFGAFYHCDSLTDIELPQSIETVEPRAFTYTPWVEQFLQSQEEGPFLISGGVLVAYKGNEEEVTIPDTVRVIAAEVFSDNVQLRRVILPNSLTSIGEAAFSGCSSLNEIIWGNGLISIKDRAFYECGLTQVSIPSSVETMGILAFDNQTDISYESGDGSNIERTYETSAQRLSNEEYRNLSSSDGTEGVSVTGQIRGTARLEGAANSYSLTVNPATDISPMELAYQRSFGTSAPDGIVVYDLTLTDASGIPITKTGKQLLTVNLPIPEQLEDQNLVVITLDRNGQLELVEAQRVVSMGDSALGENSQGEPYLSFQINHLSLFGIYGDGSSYDESTVLVEEVSMSSLSDGPAGDSDSARTNANRLRTVKLLIGGALLLTGLILLLQSRRSRRYKSE